MAYFTIKCMSNIRQQSIRMYNGDKMFKLVRKYTEEQPIHKLPPMVWCALSLALCLLGSCLNAFGQLALSIPFHITAVIAYYVSQIRRDMPHLHFFIFEMFHLIYQFIVLAGLAYGGVMSFKMMNALTFTMAFLQFMRLWNYAITRVYSTPLVNVPMLVGFVPVILGVLKAFPSTSIIAMLNDFAFKLSPWRWLYATFSLGLKIFPSWLAIIVCLLVALSFYQILFYLNQLSLDQLISNAHSFLPVLVITLWTFFWQTHSDYTFMVLLTGMMGIIRVTLLMTIAAMGDEMESGMSNALLFIGTGVIQAIFSHFINGIVSLFLSSFFLLLCVMDLSIHACTAIFANTKIHFFSRERKMIE